MDFAAQRLLSSRPALIGKFFCLLSTEYGLIMGH